LKTENWTGVRLMGVKRQIRRNAERKAKKRCKKQIEHAIEDMNKTPHGCTKCQAQFDPKNNFHLDNWMIRVIDAGVEMYCNKCKKNLKLD